jgi:hypothetical protein
MFFIVNPFKPNPILTAMIRMIPHNMMELSTLLFVVSFASDTHTDGSSRTGKAAAKGRSVS